MSERTSAITLFRIFLGLGCTSFGGPVAHLGYFRHAFVVRRGWFDEATYADIMALAQFLPGPASSQVGMMIGLARGGLLGMLAAWVGFTLPSALILGGFAYGVMAYGDVMGGGWLVGLKAAAAAVVAQALIGMARALAPDGPRAGLAALGFITVLGLSHFLQAPVWAQIAAILAGGLGGLMLCKPQGAQASQSLTIPVGRPVAVAALILFALLLLGPAAVTLSGMGDLADRFYRAGALVFGGGHVVLPLLQAEMVESGFVARDVFLAGYGAAQAVPGPLFTFATFLGASSGGVTGAVVATIMIFLPSMLLTVGALPFWSVVRQWPMMRRALMGVNAGVVGLLGAAFYDPVLVSVIDRPGAIALAALAFVALSAWRVPPWAVVIGAGLVGAVLF
jgi:chromate transporter